MIVKKSRYKNTKPFAQTIDGTEVFPGLRAREIGAATGMVEHEVKSGDRLDSLARHYYNDDRLWWRIVDANSESVLGMDMLDEKMAGQVILIPKGKE